MRIPFNLCLRVALKPFAAVCVLLAFGSAASAQVVIAPAPTIGSSNPVSPEPAIIRPSTTPCKVALLTNQAFANASNVNFSYTPPSACPGPWAKVVFSADFTVPAGVQLGRSAAIYVGNATIFRGSTGEPRTGLTPSWHVENDVTDLSAVFNAAQSGVAAVNNVIAAPYTSTIYANAELDFYPVGAGVLAAVVPNQVIPIVADATNPSQSFTSATPLSVTVTTLPKNVTQLYLDLIAQPDEYWWLAVPDAQVAPFVHASPGVVAANATGFRELNISIDGTPAGIAPNHPYVYTGGIDPYLWEPIAGAQALNFKPYRINLTPFAGALSDGNPHTIIINDINTVGTASVNADLLVYTDPTSGTTTTGSVTANSLTATAPAFLTESGSLDGNGYGTKLINESSTQKFTITGSTTGSAGKVTTTVTETVNFENAKQLTNSATQNVLIENLTSTVDSTEATVTTSGTTTKTSHTENPLQATVNIVKNGDGSFSQFSTVELRDINNLTGPGSFTSNASEDVVSTDQASLDSSFNVTSNSGQASTGTYTSTDSNGNNYSSTLTAANNVLTGATTKSASSDSTLFLTATPTSSAQGLVVTLVAKVIPANNTATPTGYITFYNNGNVISVIGTSTGTSTVNITFLPVGNDTITASYTGDTNYQAETSNSVVVTISGVAPTLTLGAFTPTSLSLSQGSSGIVTVPVTGNSSFGGTVTFTCTGAPAGATCVVTPTSVALSFTSSPSTETAGISVLVTTTAPTTTVSAAGLHMPAPMIARSIGGISIAGLFLLCLPKRRGKRWSALTMMAFLVLGAGSMATLSGCGGKAPAGTTTTTTGGTPTGAYTLTVTASSGTVTNSATFALNVTK